MAAQLPEALHYPNARFGSHSTTPGKKTSAAIIVLLVFMLMMNGLAIYLRNRFEQRW